MRLDALKQLIFLKIYLFIYRFIYLFLDTVEGREKERDRNINV